MSLDVNLASGSVSCNFGVRTGSYCWVLMVEVLLEGWKASEILFSELDTVQVSALATTEVPATTSKSASSSTASI